MNIKHLILAAALVGAVITSIPAQARKKNAQTDRQYWVETMIKISDPVLRNTAEGTLKKNMPYESVDSLQTRRDFSYLEALGRTICGMAPWLELEGVSDPQEAKLQAEYRIMARTAIANAVDPASPDYMAFDHGRQPLVDAAYLAEGLLRAPKQLWYELDSKTQENLAAALRATNSIQPHESNWLLFASTVEAALLEFTGSCDMERMLYGVRRFRDAFYKGDGFYGDGKDFHMDYYNSFVIHPMLLDVLIVMQKHNVPEAEFIAVEKVRHTRVSEVLERFIAPDGTYPVVGRSIAACRFGVFHCLAQDALMQTLPSSVTPGQVRCALTAVIKRQLQNPDNFDKDGWLAVGFAGSQLRMSENYVNTGSNYHCVTVFLPLGLPQTAPFWADAPAPYSGQKVWSGAPVRGDHAIKK